LRKTALLIVFLLAFSVGQAWADGWDTPFKERIIDAALRLSPDGLKKKLASGPESITYAVSKADVLNKNGRRDPNEHFAAVVKMINDPSVNESRLLAELSSLAFYAIDRTAPRTSRAFFMQVNQSPGIARARLDAYHQINDYAQFIDAVRWVVGPRTKDIEKKVSEGVAGRETEVGNDLAILFNVYANIAVDVWCSVAVQAGLDLGQGREAGFLVEPQRTGFNIDLYRPAENVDLSIDLRKLVTYAEGKNLINAINLGDSSDARNSGADDDDELIIEDGVTISGTDAQNTANQLASSDMHVDGCGVDRMRGLDEEAIRALQNMGIDVNSNRRPFHETRGGVKPGEILHVGDFNFRMDNISTVEVGSRSQKRVFMQLSDSALGTGGGGGFLNQKVVGAVIQANVGAFKTCFERRLRQIPDLSGRVFVEFIIGLDGAVSQVSVLENTTRDAVFAQCLTRQVQRLRFPPPEGGEVTFVFPFIFEQALSF